MLIFLSFSEYIHHLWEFAKMSKLVDLICDLSKLGIKVLVPYSLQVSFKAYLQSTSSYPTEVAVIEGITILPCHYLYKLKQSYHLKM